MDFGLGDYVFSADRIAAVIDGIYDLRYDKILWQNEIDLRSSRNVTATIACALARLAACPDVSASAGAIKPAVLRSTWMPRALLTPRIARVTRVLWSTSLFDATGRAANFIAGDWDVGVRLTGYGAEATRWTSATIKEGAEAANFGDSFPIGSLLVLSDSAVQRQDAEVFLYPAGDRVNRIPNRTLDRPIRLGEAVLVSPGKYDVLLRLPFLGAAGDTWALGKSVGANEHVVTTLPLSCGTLDLEMSQPGGDRFRGHVGRGV